MKNDFKILVVDDTPEQLDLIRRALKNYNYTLFSATNGAGCMEMLLQEKPDILLLDVVLPDVNGIDLAKKIKSNPEFSSIYIILISAIKTKSEQAAEGLEEGADAYIVRPVERRELQARIEAACRSIQAERKLKETFKIKWRTTFNAISDAIFLIDNNSVIKQANESATAMLNKPKEELIGRRCHEMVHCCNDHIEGCPFVRMKGSLKKETMLLPMDDKWFEVTVDPLIDSAGKLKGAVHIMSDITARKLTEIELHESEKRYRTLYDSNPLMIFTLNQEGTILSVNQTVISQLGYSVEEIVGNSVLMLFHEDDRPKVIGQKEKCLLCPDEINNWELRKITKQGKIIWVQETARVLSDQDGNKYILVMCEDITWRKQIEEALQEKEHLLSESQRIAHIGGWSWDLHGPIIWTGETYHIYGVSPETFIPTVEALVNLIHPDDRSAMQHWIEDCAAGKKPDELTFRTLLPDGSIRFLTGSGELIYDAGNKTKLIFGTVLDITERKRAVDVLHESQQYNRTLFEKSVIGLALTDMNGKMVDVNLAYANIIGRTIEETKQLTYWDITPEKYAEQEQEQLTSLNTAGSYGPYEKEYIHKDGHLVPVRLQGLIIERNGERLIWSSVENITEKKKAEDKITEQLDELRRWQNVMIGRETRNIELKHEVNELLKQLGKPEKYKS